MERKKAQIWVETVVYTLIGISIIGILLAIATPRINEMRDRLVIDQTIDFFNEINGRIVEIQGAPGNQRTLGVRLSRGTLFLDGVNNTIRWRMTSNYEYSQPGTPVSVGRISVLTEESNPYTIYLTLDYSNLNITVSGRESIQELGESPTPYDLIFRNQGDGRINIEVR